MVPLASLWLPILLSAVAVFIVSSMIHMFLGYHRTDLAKLPNEDAVADVLRSVPPGDYALPHAGSMAGMKDPVFMEKMKRGPVVGLTILPGGNRMQRSLVLWFVYSLVASVFAGYVAGRALPAGTDYLQVFRFAGVTAFTAYAFALAQQSIWFGRRWSTTIKAIVDGLIYGLVTAGFFGWLWPK